MKAVFFFLILALVNVTLANHLGSISVSFKTEDPATGDNADATIFLGDSLEVTVTLDPAPEFPVRLDIVSSLPEIIKVSHPRITFNRGQSQGIITVESPPDGKIGISTIIVTVEKQGLYIPTTFDILVQGDMLIDFAEANPCISVEIPAEFIISIKPHAPETIELSVSSSSGELSTDVAVIPLGQDAVKIVYTGTVVGPTTISVSTEFYANTDITFDTLGTIVVTRPQNGLVEDSPAVISVSVLPEDPEILPNIFASGSNAIVTPASFTLEEDGSSDVEVIPEFSGSAQVTFRANGYCPTVETFAVADALLCVDGFIPNILATECVPCPGYTFSYYTDPIDCNNEGTCSYSKCFDTSAVCFCFFPYIGSACQFNPQVDDGLFDQEILNDDNFRMSIEGLANTVSATKFLASGNLVDGSLQPGRAIVAGYFPDNLFFGAVDPSFNPPGNSVFSGIGWYWENTCFENTLIQADFMEAPVSTRLYIIPEAFTNLEILQIELHVYDVETETWLNSYDVCNSAGFDAKYPFVDFYEMTVTTEFCRPGQYALFVVPKLPPVQNTGNTSPPIAFEQNSGTTPGTGKTGWQPAPPLPLPVQDPVDAYRPSLKLPSTSSDGSTIVASFLLLLVSIALCC